MARAGHVMARPVTVDPALVEAPCFVVDKGALADNLAILRRVQAEAGCKILLALKGFAMWSLFPQIRTALPGITASSTHEARLGREQFGGEVHVCAPAYSDADFEELLELCDHVVFNSFSQWKRLRPLAEAHRREGGPEVQFGMRVNPEHREVDVELYDPCGMGSRLGVVRSEFDASALEGLSGLHFHNLCELGSDALARTLDVFETRFGEFIPRMKWVNFGGGHHITRADYDVDQLIALVKEFRARWGVDVYLEPGEAIALGTGVLVASVLDLVQNDGDIAILDTSATAHMPDTLEMPYRAQIVGADFPGDKQYTYRLGGLTCLAGDVIGEYSFDHPLSIGDKLVFLDMAHYTMVKTTTFNGVRLPSIATWDPDTRKLEVVRRFGYEDYKNRLG
ncbi:MAG TPA: carboxynorspermidine decarboxylase [Nannocystaceae bacterium]|nr:carboxynorspermidine decarboxylase [Nannocystaceae bacterium]